MKFVHTVVVRKRTLDKYYIPLWETRNKVDFDNITMFHSLAYYNYSQCFARYTERIMNLRQAKIHGEVIVAKPVLMLALIDGIESGVFTDNRFVLNEWLEDRYLTLMKEYTRGSQFTKPTDISNPFWHLSTDGFWHLKPEMVADKSATPSRSWLKENVSFACFDDDLWVLLRNKEWRTRLRDYIVEHKFTDTSWFRNLSEGLAMLATILLVA